MSTKELVAEIEKRFEIILPISIFFPVLMATYFDIVGGPDKDYHTAFIFFALPALYIASYVIFELRKILPPIPPLALQVLDWSLLLNILCFAAPVIFVVMAYAHVTLSRWTYLVDLWTFIGSGWGVVTLPFAIFLFVIASEAIAIAAKVIGKQWANKKIF
ncbi:MAG: hypothetical protein ABSE18_04510 [Minisyncoccia bacterium]|jgi:hypothetical protein